LGLRGFGSVARKTLQDEIDLKPSRILPWKKPKLTRLQRVIAFLQFLPITKGKCEGQQLKLLPNQRAFVRDLYGRPRGHEVKLGVFSEPRGNGKTGLIAGMVLCHLLGPESEPRGACYSAGIDRQQAALIFDEMEAIILAVPEFSVRCNIQRFRKAIEVIAGDGDGSKYEALSADGRRAHGLAPSFWAYDELAQAKDRTLLDNLQTAMGKRNRSLGVIISTQASSDLHPLSEIIDDGINGQDNSVVVHLTAAPVDADPFDHEVIRRVNPALGIFLDEGDVFAEAERARRMPSFESAFRNLRLNQRIAPHGRNLLFTLEAWAEGDGAVDESIFTDGRPVYGGLDLSACIDLTALVLCAEDGDGVVHFKPFAWTPGDGLEVRQSYDRAPYDVWIRQGHLTAVPGAAIDYGFVAVELGTLSGTMNLVQVNYDRWSIKSLQQALARYGVAVPLEPFGQGYVSMAPAINELEKLVAARRIRHGGNPLLRWCFSNAIAIKDPAGNRKLDKSKPYGRIDVAVAAVMAIGAMKCQETPQVEIAAMIG
jgi:phage terminase large subunit-like protein